MQYGNTIVTQQQTPFIIYKSFNVLVDIKSEWQANKGVILYL